MTDRIVEEDTLTNNHGQLQSIRQRTVCSCEMLSKTVSAPRSMSRHPRPQFARHRCCSSFQRCVLILACLPGVSAGIAPNSTKRLAGVTRRHFERGTSPTLLYFSQGTRSKVPQKCSCRAFPRFLRMRLQNGPPLQLKIHDGFITHM